MADSPTLDPRLPEHIIFNILRRVCPTTLSTASQVCTSWRNLIFSGDHQSCMLLWPHVAALRERFGEDEVPCASIPISALRALLARYAKQDLFGSFTTTTLYDVTELAAASIWNDSCPVPLKRRRFAVCDSLIAFAKHNKILVFETLHRQMKFRIEFKVPSRPVALAISELYLATLDTKKVHLYYIVGRGSDDFRVRHVHSLLVPELSDPTAIALTSIGAINRPLVAVLGTELSLIYPPKGKLDGPLGLDLDENRAPGTKQSAKSLSVDSSRPAKRREHELILTAPGTCAGITFPVQFTMMDRQLCVSATDPQDPSSWRGCYFGSAFSDEDPYESHRRYLFGGKLGQDLSEPPHTTEQLWKYYKQQDWQDKPKWTLKYFHALADKKVEDVVHIRDSFYVLTESETRVVKIAAIFPFETKFTLYTAPGGSEERRRKHCGYTVFQGVPTKNGTRFGGYIAFSPSDGCLKIVSIDRIPWFREGSKQKDTGSDLVNQAADIAIGTGCILDMCASIRRLAIVFEDRVVIVGLDTCGADEGEVSNFWIDSKGGVHEGVHAEITRAGGECIMV